MGNVAHSNTLFPAKIIQPSVYDCHKFLEKPYIGLKSGVILTPHPDRVKKLISNILNNIK